MLEIRNPDGSWPWRINLHVDVITKHDSFLDVVLFGVFEPAG